MNSNYHRHRMLVQHLINMFQYGRIEFDPIECVWVDDLGKVSWFNREATQADMHSVIDRALRLAPAANLYALVREYPHAADTDSSRIAYTRNDADGERNRQTVTTAAKYLTRHFPTLQSHEIRDLTSTLGAKAFHMWDTIEGIIKGVQEGPRSCMQWDASDVADRGGHPYEVYDPALGWRMAVRLEGTMIMGRALVNVADTPPIFVRSYNRDPHGGYSHSDTALEAWLREQGIEKSSDWSGCEIKYIDPHGRGEPLLPYLDGDEKYVRLSHTCTRFVICESGDGEYQCDNTNGTGDDVSGSTYTCEHCGSTFRDEDDITYAGRYGDIVIGPCCADEFRYVTGRRGDTYYIHDDSAVYVSSTGTWYDTNYLADNNIVELENGDHEHLDNCVNIDDAWYNVNDRRVVWLEDTEMHALKHDGCWQCAASRCWYSDDIEPVEIDGDFFHPDSDQAQRHADEQSETNEE